MLKSSPMSGFVVPLYHPTSILLVDDNVEFVRSLRLVLESGFECFAFHSAAEAIEFIRSEPLKLGDFVLPSAPESETAMEHIKDREQRLLHLRVARLPKLFADKSRFVRTSVVVADNAMPGMSGLDMLEALRDVPVRKVLLSGMVEDQVARKALSSGLIDAFFPKQDPCLHDGLIAHLRRLQIDFFLRVTQPFQPALASGDTRFLHDLAFHDVFARFVNQRGIIEHCVLMQPPGILGLDEDGNPAILLVADDDYRQASFEIAQAEGAPVALLRQLVGLQTLAVFPTPSGFYSREMEASWSQYVWPSVALGEQSWQVATIDEPEIVRQVCGSIASYAEHRQRKFN